MASKESRRSSLRDFAKYSGLGLQIGIIIYLGSVAGEWLDNQCQGEGFYKQLITILSVFLAVTSVIIQLIRKQ